MSVRDRVREELDDAECIEEVQAVLIAVAQTPCAYPWLAEEWARQQHRFQGREILRACEVMP